MITIKIKDNMTTHQPSFFNSKNQKNILISKDQIEEGDIVIYTNTNFLNIDKKAKLNIAFLCESYGVHPKYYKCSKGL